MVQRAWRLSSRRLPARLRARWCVMHASHACEASLFSHAYERAMRVSVSVTSSVSDPSQQLARACVCLCEYVWWARVSDGACSSRAGVLAQSLVVACHCSRALLHCYCLSLHCLACLSE
jgi:hypothetical protein